MCSGPRHKGFTMVRTFVFLLTSVKNKELKIISIIQVNSSSLRFPTNNMYTLAVFTESVISIRGVSVGVIKADTQKVALASTSTFGHEVHRKYVAGGRRGSGISASSIPLFAPPPMCTGRVGSVAVANEMFTQLYLLSHWAAFPQSRLSRHHQGRTMVMVRKQLAR